MIIIIFLTRKFSRYAVIIVSWIISLNELVHTFLLSRFEWTYFWLDGRVEATSSITSWTLLCLFIAYISPAAVHGASTARIFFSPDSLDQDSHNSRITPVYKGQSFFVASSGRVQKLVSKKTRIGFAISRLADITIQYLTIQAYRYNSDRRLCGRDFPVFENPPHSWNTLKNIHEKPASMTDNRWMILVKLDGISLDSTFGSFTTVLIFFSCDLNLFDLFAKNGLSAVI